ncbi:MAG: hypothetical protein IJ309_03355 [Clostridia bacterium]|nr:hypothetical protein [Clostridia bacterium]
MAEKESNRKERKQQLTIWLKPSLIERIESLRQADNCESKSEFIEKALEFYMGYLSSKENRYYLPNVLTSTIKSIVGESSNRQNTILFKMVVEMNMMMNILASEFKLEESMLAELRGYCVEQVKRSNGLITFDDVVRSLK